MRITILDQVESNVIAKDGVDGEFFVRTDGSVWYHNPADEKVWFVNNDEHIFRRCATAFDQYCHNVLNSNDEDRVVQDFEQELLRFGVLQGKGNECAYWPAIVEQTKAGLL